MRLASVTLRRPRKLGNMELAGNVVREDNVDGGLRFDEATQSVAVGDIHIPREEVIEWERANEQLVCQHCEKEFSNSKALGSHVRFKHPEEKQ